MSSFDAYDALRRIAAKKIAGQTVNLGDFYTEDGLLVCGVCKKPRQKIILVDAPTKESPDRKMELKVPTNCECDLTKIAAEEKAAADRAAMDRIKRLKTASLMDEKFRQSTFQNFSVNKHNEKNLRLCKRYATAFDEMVAKNQGLLLWGGVGTGKSFAAACIANYLLDRGVPVIMTSMVKLLGLIQNGGESENEALYRLNYAKLVIFDDLGAERSTDYALEKVYGIIDDRYRKQLPMIFTTNLTMNEMSEETDIRYGRIYDRVFEVCYPIQFVGPSWRKRMAGKRFEEMGKLRGETAGGSDES